MGSYYQRIGVLLSEDGVLLSENGVLLSEDGVLLSEDGVLLSEDGVLLSEDGVLLSEDGVLLSGLTPPHYWHCPKPGPGFPTLNVVVYILCSIVWGNSCGCSFCWYWCKEKALKIPKG
jgi:sulfur transfer complex TusBCD TusB component (DsrH family)